VGNPCLVGSNPTLSASLEPSIVRAHVAHCCEKPTKRYEPVLFGVDDTLLRSVDPEYPAATIGYVLELMAVQPISPW
jgi:hypothetical protein